MKYLKKLFKITTLLMAATFIQSCIADNVRDCEEKGYICLKVTAQDGSDITATGVVESADLYIYDQDGHFLQTTHLIKEQIIQRERILIRNKNIKGLQVVVWGNLYDNESISRTEEDELETSSVILKTYDEECTLSPDDLFYGMKIIQVQSVDSSDEIIIARKNARLNITVRGLPENENADDYYFIIDLNNNGYYFTGKPVRNKIEMKKRSGFNAMSDLISDQPFNIIHSFSTNRFPDDNITIYLYKNGVNTPIASIDKDINGKEISPAAGELTNILINLSSLQTHIIVTPWDEIYQWVEWE